MALIKDLFDNIPQDNMIRGTVKWFNDEKGYGFIIPENGGNDIFFHFSSLQIKGFKTIEKGQLVEFELDDSHPDKKKASRVKIIFC